MSGPGHTKCPHLQSLATATPQQNRNPASTVIHLQLRLLGQSTEVAEVKFEIVNTDLSKLYQSQSLSHFNRGLFQGDSLSPLLFCLCVAPLPHYLRQEVGFQSQWQTWAVTHLMFMDDLKLYEKSEEEMNATLDVAWLLKVTGWTETEIARQRKRNGKWPTHKQVQRIAKLWNLTGSRTLGLRC